MADGTVREIFDDRTDRHDWDFGGTAVATHFRHGDVSNLDTSLGHKAILHNLNGKRARRIAWPRGERLDTGLSLWIFTDVGRHPNAHRLIATRSARSMVF